MRSIRIIIRRIKPLLAAFALAAVLACTAQAEPVKLSSAWIGEHEPLSRGTPSSRAGTRRPDSI
ncbi:MAG: hypothetical protein V8Q84_01580 [Bilophila sp.]